MKNNVRTLLLSAALISLSMGLAYPYFSEYAYSLTGNPFLAGMISSLRSLTCVFSFLAGGMVADRLGRKKPIVWGTFLLGLSLLLYSLARNAKDLVLASLLEGTAYFYFPAFNAMIMDSVKEGFLGVFTLAVVVEHLPYSLSPVLGGMMRDRWEILGLRMAFLAGGTMVLLMALVRQWWLSETFKEKKISQNPFKGLLSFHRLLKGLILLRIFFLISALSMFNFFLVLYAIRDLKLMSFTEFGLALALSSLIYPLSLPLSKRLGKVPPSFLYSHLLLMGSLSPLLVLTHSIPCIFLSLVILNLCGSLTYGIERGSVALLTPQVLRGRAEAFMDLSFYLGSSLGTATGGYFYSISPSLVMWVSFFLFLSGAPLSFLLFREWPKEVPRKF
ncbi:MAG: MFS transporter [Candidatus Hadarchaeales archaeon]